MNKVIEIFENIKNTSGLNDKKSIIATNKDNALFRKCLVFLLDSNVQTGLSSKKIGKKVRKCEYFSPNFEELIEYLKTHNTGTDDDISFVQSFINNQPENCHDFYTEMVTKSYRLGADAKLVNSVVPGLIPTFDVALGTPIDKVKLIGNEWISLSHKLNGTRCAFVGNKCMTRQGKTYIGLDHIINELTELGYSDYFVDGELVYKNKEGLSDSEAFQIGTGIANSKAATKEELKLVVFDIFPLNEFWSGKSKETYKERCDKYLIELMKKLEGKTDSSIEVVSIFYQGYDHKEIWKWLDYAEENDLEGIMINLDTPYECKRTKNLIKVKKFFDCDILCTDIEEGSGRNKGTLGALVCDYKGNKVRVGSGFSDEDRKTIWENPNFVIGKIITVKYKEETKNKDGGLSVQFPTFICIRSDKSEPSYN